MKLWNSFGSEHSANLVLIGTFRDAASAEQVQKAIDRLTECIRKSGEDFHEADRYPDAILNVLREIKFHSIAPHELEQFNYDFHAKREDNNIVLKTDEVDISAFLKLMIDRGARVQVYSAHDYPESIEKGSD